MSNQRQSKLRIDREFQALIKPLAKEEYTQLEQSILSEGLRDNLILWKGQDILLDGHHRLRICREHKIGIPESKKTRIELANRDKAKFWIIQNQFARRNLNKLERCMLALKIESPIMAMAREKLRTHTKQGYLKSNKAEAVAVDTLQELAKIAGVGRDFMYKYRKIFKETDEIVQGLINDGHLSIHHGIELIKVKDHEARMDKICDCLTRGISAVALKTWIDTGRILMKVGLAGWVNFCPLGISWKTIQDCKRCKYYQGVEGRKLGKNGIIEDSGWINCTAYDDPKIETSYSPGMKKFVDEYTKILKKSNRIQEIKIDGCGTLK